ncbi:MAG: hypothetical protein J6S76_00205 [Clostridia bacterium]|nr:hypothetical protein [Clostridia bacterium]
MTVNHFAFPGKCSERRGHDDRGGGVSCLYAGFPGGKVLCGIGASKSNGRHW